MQRKGSSRLLLTRIFCYIFSAPKSLFNSFETYGEDTAPFHELEWGSLEEGVHYLWHVLSVSFTDSVASTCRLVGRSIAHSFGITTNCCSHYCCS
jgi:hypothetical protein